MTDFHKGDLVRIADDLRVEKQFRRQFGTVLSRDGLAVPSSYTRLLVHDQELQVLTALLETAYILTGEEPEVLDALAWQSPKSDLRDKAITVLASHLNPMVTQTFTVTFERPVDGPAHTEAAIRAVLETQYRNPTTVEETTA